mgnify:CR=1 FL=1
MTLHANLLQGSDADAQSLLDGRWPNEFARIGGQAAPGDAQRQPGDEGENGNCDDSGQHARPLRPCHAGKPHEGQRQETRHQKGDRLTGESGGYIGQGQTLAQPGEHHQHQGESHGGAKAVEQALEEAVLLLHIEQGHAQYRTVGGDQW